ncbi:MAG: zinc-finger domain-containing protein [Bordetella sp.]|nr:MAG: zinc-finger domain-containing protein [Bordetella sp.]
MIPSIETKFSCPTSKTDLWNMHPRIFLEFDNAGYAKCPYCGTVFQKKEKDSVIY